MIGGGGRRDAGFGFEGGRGSVVDEGSERRKTVDGMRVVRCPIDSKIVLARGYGAC